MKDYIYIRMHTYLDWSNNKLIRLSQRPYPNMTQTSLLWANPIIKMVIHIQSND